MRSGGLAAAALAGAVALAPSVAGARLSGEDHQHAVDFVLANSRHVLYHEIGHLYVDLFDLPVLGKEEDAVDMLATLALLADRSADPLGAIADTADGWLYSDRRRGRNYIEDDFSGQHSLDIQRSFTITCLAVGSDFDTNSRFATRFGLSVDRQKLCEEEYYLARDSWDTVLSPHRRGDAPGGQITVRYVPSEEFREMEDLLRTNRVLEGAADWVSKSYALPEDITVLADTCGEVNAFYIPATREVVLCYEWADFYYTLFEEDVLPARQEAERRRGLKLVKIEFVASEAG